MVWYQWPKGTGAPVSAQAVGEEIERLAGERGGVTPAQVVEAARPAESPLHPLFSWDRAEQWREMQARQVLRQLKAAQDEDLRLARRAFVNIAAEEGSPPVYVPARVALANEGLRRQVTQEALSRMREWRAVYGAFIEFAQNMTAIDVLDDTIEQLEVVA